ncbi:MAG: alpha/beta fold hydrolase, partial [Myxococcota bacterium]|nr:alpha/beta fold hydrolase [Myxococcota bacterium]
MPQYALYGTLFAFVMGLVSSPSLAADADFSLKMRTMPKTDRSYLLATPRDAPTPSPRPLLIMLHGGMGNAQSFERSTDVTPAAIRAGWIVAFPNGTEGGASHRNRRTWNAGRCCGRASRTQSEDRQFIENMIDQIDERESIDRKKIYVIGFSNGGMMAYSLACHSEKPIRAIVVVGASLVSQPCAQPSRSVAILALHGDQDDSVPLEGGRGA